MKMKEVRNGSLYQKAGSGELVRVRSKLNSSSVSCSTSHNNKLVAVKAKELEMASIKSVESYLKEAELVSA